MAGRRTFVFFVLGVILLVGTATNARADDWTSTDTSASSSSARPVELEKSASEATVDDDSPGDELSRILKDESISRKRYSDLVSRANRLKWAAVGMGGLLGVSLVVSLAKGLHSLKQSQLGKSGKAVHLGSSSIALLSLVGGFLSYWMKKRTENRAKEHAKELLRHRHAMLAELKEGDQREAEVMDRADEIADITDNFGLYDADIDAAMRATD